MITDKFMTEETARELINLLREHDSRNAHALRHGRGPLPEGGPEPRCASGAPDPLGPLPHAHPVHRPGFGHRPDSSAPRGPLPPEEGPRHGHLPVPHACGIRVSLDEEALAAALASTGAEHVAAEVAADVPGEVKLVYALVFGIPVSFRPAAGGRRTPEGPCRAHAAGWGNPLLAPEALEHLARVFGADPDRIEAELAGAPQHMVALILALSGFTPGAPAGSSPEEGGPCPGDPFGSVSGSEASEGALADAGIEPGPLPPGTAMPDAPGPAASATAPGPTANGGGAPEPEEV